VPGVDKPADRPEAAAYLPLFSSHASSFGPAPFMIVPAQVQHSMNQQGHHFFFQRPLRRLGLALSERQGNDHVPEMCSRPVEVMGRPAFPERKGEHVGPSVLASKPVVEPSHPAIAHERDTDVRRRFPDQREHRLGQSQELPATQPNGSYIDLKGNGH
jgi:hypothetical protein